MKYSLWEHYLGIVYKIITILLYIIVSVPDSLVYTQDIIVDTPYIGDITGSGGIDHVVINSSLAGSFIGVGGNTTININGAGVIINQITLAQGTANITVEAGGRVGKGIRIAGGDTTMVIRGVVDGGIVLGDGSNTITVSGTAAAVGSIPDGTKRSIVTGNGNDTITLLGTISTNAIELGGGINTITVDNSESGGIYTGTEKDTYTIRNGSRISGSILSGGGGDAISIIDSTLLGFITTQGTGPIGDDTVHIIASDIVGDINTGSGNDIVSFEENSSLQGSFIALGNVRMNSTNFSTISDAITVAGSLILDAPSGIIVNGAVEAGANSVYTVLQSTFNSGIFANGATSITASATKIIGDILLKNAGLFSVTLVDSSVSNSVDAGLNTAKTEVILTRSTAQSIFFGTGENILRSLSTTVNTITANNLLVESTDTVFTKGIQVDSLFTATIVSSKIHVGITTNNSAENNIVTIRNSSVEGTIALGGVVLATIEGTKVVGDIITNNKADTISFITSTGNNITTMAGDDILHITGSTLRILDAGDGKNAITVQDSTIDTVRSGAGGSTIAISRSSIHSLLPGVGNDTIHIDNSTIYNNIISADPVDIDTLFFSGTNRIFGEMVDLGLGTVTVDGTVQFTKPEETAINLLDSTVRVSSLDITENGLLEANKNNLMSRLILDVNTLKNLSTKPTIRLYADIRGGRANQLDLTGVTAFSGNPDMIEVKAVPGFGVPVDRIENVVLSSPHIRPNIYRHYALVSGYLYTLEENAILANSYDLVNQGVSPTNYGYAAVHSGIRTFNTSIWRGLLGHMQEIVQIEREEDGTKKPAGGFFNSMSVWAKGHYGVSKNSPFDAPELNEHNASVLAGIDFTNIRLSNSVNMMLEVFAGFGLVWAEFSELPMADISFKTNQTGFTVGGLIGIEHLAQNRTGKLFVTAFSWYTGMLNQLESNIFTETNKWSNDSINVGLSMGYSAYINGTVITPQVDIAYFRTFAKQYESPDYNSVSFTTDERIVGRASILLGQNTAIGITPYMRVGIETPLFMGSSKGYTIVGDENQKYSYSTSGLSTDVGLGVSYKGKIGGFALTLSLEANMYFGAVGGVDGTAQIGFNF